MTLRHVVCAIAHGWGSDCTDTGRRCCWDGTNTSLLVFQAMGSSSAIRACPHVDCSKYFFVTVSHSAPASAALDLADTRWPARRSSCGKSLTLVCLLPRVLTASRGRRGGGRLPGRLGRGLRTQVAGGALVIGSEQSDGGLGPATNGCRILCLAISFAASGTALFTPSLKGFRMSL